MEDVGSRLKSVRKVSGLSQRELAKRAGVTNSTISMIEKNSVSPSIGSLKKVLSGLPMTLLEFFDTGDADSPEVPVVYRKEDFRTSSAGADIEWELIGKHFPNRQMAFMLETYAPGSDTGEESYHHEGEEAGYVIAGTLELVVEGEVHVLNKGEGYYFDSQRPHRFRNNGDVDCQIISAANPADL